MSNARVNLFAIVCLLPQPTRVYLITSLADRKWKMKIRGAIALNYGTLQVAKFPKNWNLIPVTCAPRPTNTLDSFVVIKDAWTVAGFGVGGVDMGRLLLLEIV